MVHITMQANWRLHKHRKEKKQLEEQHLTQWAEQHLAAAQRSRKSLTAAAESDSDSETESAESSSSKWRRNRVTGEQDYTKPAKPVVQPWARMIGREAPITDGIAPPTPGAGKSSKWRGAVSATVAASKLADASSGAAANGGSAASGAALLLQEVPVTRLSDEGAGEPLPR